MRVLAPLLCAVVAAASSNEWQWELEKSFEKRDPTIQDLIASVRKVSESAGMLAQDVAALDVANLTTAIEVSRTGLAAQSAMNQSVTVATMIGTVEMNDGVKLIRPIHDLVTNSLVAVGGLTSKKQVFDQLQLSSVVLSTFKILESSAQDLQRVLLTKLVTKLRDSAEDLVKPVFVGLHDAVGCYNGTGVCHNITDPKASATRLISAGRRDLTVGSASFALVVMTLVVLW